MKKTGVVAIAVAVAGMCLSSCEKDEEVIVTDSITFEELNTGSAGYWNGADGTGGFETGNGIFPNSFIDWGDGLTSWSGFGYSRLKDVSTAGFSNQYSCYAGGGAAKSVNFGIISVGDTLEFKTPETVTGISLANSTYTALSMRDGDLFAKKFGGESGNDPDWFELLITGIDKEGRVTGTYRIALADYRAGDSNLDYISNAWTSLSLDQLGEVKKLAFGFESSDAGEWGMNTPGYACIDNIAGTLAK